MIIISYMLWYAFSNKLFKHKYDESKQYFSGFLTNYRTPAHPSQHKHLLLLYKQKNL